jgi:mevalonate kinase
MTTIAEHKLNVIRQVDELTEESLIEVEKLIVQLKENQKLLAKKHYQGKKIRAILEEGSRLGIFSAIPNPAEWQKEMRKDRTLPGRD